jgi:3-dehydrotetronate 4-kinase
MTIALGCIADDYTGASDFANTLTRVGLRTVQTIGVPRDLELPEIDAVVVALKSRSIEAARAVAMSRAAHQWLRAQGASHVLFKVCSTFDSTDAGNIGPVIEALQAESGDAIVLVTPAFPETGRTVYQGNLFVGSVPLNESPLKDHPLNPMHDANLVRVLARQSRNKVGLVDLATVAKGVNAIRARLDQLSDSGIRAVIADGVFEPDLEAIAQAAMDHRVSVGASGLGLGLARMLVYAGRVRASTADTSLLGEPIGGPAACLAGSCSQATLDQIAVAERTMPVLRLDPDALIADKAVIDKTLGWALERLNRGAVLIATSSTAEKVAAIQACHGREVAGQAIEQALATLAAALVERGVRRLVVAGGETSGAVVDRLAIPAFLVGPEIAAGVPVLRTKGMKGREMVLALKSGNFGGAEFFSDALQLVQ